MERNNKIAVAEMVAYAGLGVAVMLIAIWSSFDGEQYGTLFFAAVGFVLWLYAITAVVSQSLRNQLAVYRLLEEKKKEEKNNIK